MSALVTRPVRALPRPDDALFREALLVPNSRHQHDRLTAGLAAFDGVEIRPVSAGAAPGSAGLRIAAWNAERLKYHGPSCGFVQEVAPDILLLTEADVGMARAGNRHTVDDLATGLGMGYAYGVEFLELGLGDERERAWHAGEANAVGFHGNALLSRHPFSDAAIIRLDDGAVWWLDARDGERRLGWRMAVAARIATAAGPLLAVAVHLESKTDAADRAAQVRRLLDAVEAMAGGAPVVLGGDFNTNALPPGASVAEPQRYEPLFADLAAAGFDWSACNTPDVTQRTRPDGTPQPPFRRIDWLFTRGLAAAAPRTIPAVDGSDRALSDHELIAVDVILGAVRE